MDPPIGDKSFERYARHFPSERIESGKDHRLRRIINDHIDSGRGLKRPNVASLTADDPPFHFIAFEVQNADSAFNRMIRCRALNSLNDDLLRLFLRLFLCAIADVLQHLGSFGFRRFDEVFHQVLLRLIS